jgi:putative PIN family toxin of toxin-antitoxin system
VRLVLDTNAAVSGLLWHGTPGKVIDAAHNKTVFLFTSAPLLAELRGVLVREKFATQLEARGLSAEEVFEGYAALATIVTPAIISATVANDTSDDVVLATALAAQVDAIVSGDAHLLNLKRYQGISILTVAETLARMTQR